MVLWKLIALPVHSPHSMLPMPVLIASFPMRTQPSLAFWVTAWSRGSTRLSKHFFWSSQIKHTDLHMNWLTKVSLSFCWPCAQWPSAGARKTMKIQHFYLSLQADFCGRSSYQITSPDQWKHPDSVITLHKSTLILNFILILVFNGQLLFFIYL